MNTSGAAGPSESAQSRTSPTVGASRPASGLTTSSTIATADRDAGAERERAWPSAGVSARR